MPSIKSQQYTPAYQSNSATSSGPINGGFDRTSKSKHKGPFGQLRGALKSLAKEFKGSLKSDLGFMGQSSGLMMQQNPKYQSGRDYQQAGPGAYAQNSYQPSAPSHQYAQPAYSPDPTINDFRQQFPELNTAYQRQEVRYGQQQPNYQPYQTSAPSYQPYASSNQQANGLLDEYLTKYPEMQSILGVQPSHYGAQANPQQPPDYSQHAYSHQGGQTRPEPNKQSDNPPPFSMALNNPPPAYNPAFNAHNPGYGAADQNQASYGRPPSQYAGQAATAGLGAGVGAAAAGLALAGPSLVGSAASLTNAVGFSAFITLKNILLS